MLIGEAQAGGQLELVREGIGGMGKGRLGVGVDHIVLLEHQWRGVAQLLPGLVARALVDGSTAPGSIRSA